MLSRLSRIIALLIIVSAYLFIYNPTPAKADGGPIVPYDLWGQIKEGQQIAVVTLQSQNTAKIDLFISIMDQTKESHDIIFFIPLGTKTANFLPREEDLYTFDTQMTRSLDDKLRNGANDRQYAMQILFSGALFTNGAVLIPFWAPMLLAGCAAPAAQPEATFQTESSQISIFGIDENSDLDSLINTAGLQSSVKDTLSRLRGQQIAVIKLKTQTQVTTGTSRGQPAGERGLHMTWYSTLTQGDAGATFTYFLGTGASWSKPIDLTRVYIVAPSGIDFDVTYPAIGSNQSGFDFVTGQRIADFYQIPAYAVDEARGDFGRVWRATYTQSNPVENVIIVAKTQGAMSKLAAGLQENALVLALAIALIISLACWILSWHFLMPRLLGKSSREQGRLSWYFGLIYPAINGAFIVFPGSMFLVFFIVGLTLPALVAAFVFFAGATLGIFEIIHGGHLGVTRGKATQSFILTSLASSGAYLILAFVFSLLTGII